MFCDFHQIILVKVSYYTSVQYMNLGFLVMCWYICPDISERSREFLSTSQQLCVCMCVRACACQDDLSVVRCIHTKTPSTAGYRNQAQNTQIQNKNSKCLLTHDLSNPDSKVTLKPVAHKLMFDSVIWNQSIAE